MDYIEKKCVFFDIDNTLMDNAAKKVVPNVRKALGRLQGAEYLVAITTGRAHYKARGFMEASDLHNMVCCGGDGLVVNNKLIMSTPLDRQKAIVVYKGARALGYGALVMLDDSIDVYGVDDRFLRRYGERKEPTGYIFHVDFDISQVKDIYKLYTSVPKEEEHRLTKKGMLGNLRFVETYLTFQYDRKEEGVLDMMERLGGPVEDVVIFGDDYNDPVMLDDAWFSVATDNACDALKKKANYVTERNVGDGICKACLKFGQISQDFDLSSNIKKRRFIYYQFLIDLSNLRQEIQHFYQWKLNLLCLQTP